MDTFYDSEFFTYVVLPLLIFAARVIDVSIGTLRIIFLSKGKKKIAPLMGFFEVFIWILAIGEIMKNLNNWGCYFAYAAGFATGNYVGMIIEEKLALGIHIIRIITEKETKSLLQAFHSAGYGATLLDAEGLHSRVSVVYVIINRKDLPQVERMIQSNNPQAFYSIEDVKQVKHGVFPTPTLKHKRFRSPFNRLRKGK
jgi:uncharacterized protein YebE (UPF0316 family)